jgi:hypothetical protein
MSPGVKSPPETACPICANKRQEVFQARLLHKYDVRYFLCDSCGLLQTEPAYWLDEAYGSAIADTDTGLVSRNLEISTKLSCLFYFCFDPKAQYLESAGGYGLLTRIMRDWGFDFRWHDPYCENIFARGFQWDSARGTASSGAVTAFEVLEHVMDPVAFIQNALAFGKTKTIVFSTLLYEDRPPLPDQWWYYSLSTGQHISFFRRGTLEILARKLGLRYYTHGILHVFTERALSDSLFQLCTSRFAGLLSKYVRRQLTSKTFDDQLWIADHPQAGPVKKEKTS